jgi:hypothetical protein
MTAIANKRTIARRFKNIWQSVNANGLASIAKHLHTKAVQGAHEGAFVNVGNVIENVGFWHSLAQSNCHLDFVSAIVQPG